AGKAIVGPDRGGVAETILDGETGLLAKAGSAQSFASVIEILINNSNERIRLGDNAKRAVSQGDFSQEFHNQKMLEIFTSLI
ncbi:MAG: glycosyltransferase, partial [Cyclobacteriaceae bacterium]